MPEEYYADEYLSEYARALIARLDDGCEISRNEVEIDDWKPTPKECHANVNHWCEHFPTHKKIRGWLILDFTGPAWVALEQPQRIEFLAHSIVEDENGVRSDITPSLGSGAIYRFIPHTGTEDEYASIIADYQLSRIRVFVENEPHLITFSLE